MPTYGPGGHVRTPKGYARYTLSTSPLLLWSTVPGAGIATAPNAIPGIVTARIRNVDASIAVMYRDDGIAPTVTEGQELRATEILEYDGDLDKLQVIAASGTPILKILFYGT